jgi:hypothetical protein
MKVNRTEIMRADALLGVFVDVSQKVRSEQKPRCTRIRFFGIAPRESIAFMGDRIKFNGGSLDIYVYRGAKMRCSPLQHHTRYYQRLGLADFFSRSTRAQTSVIYYRAAHTNSGSGFPILREVVNKFYDPRCHCTGLLPG